MPLSELFPLARQDAPNTGASYPIVRPRRANTWLNGADRNSGLKSVDLVYQYDHPDAGRRMMKQTAAATVAIAVLLSSACSVSQVINTGGDTKCKDFTTQDEKKQNDEVGKMLKDKSGTDPSNLEISATRLSAMAYCQTVGKPDTKISEAPHG